MFTAVLIGWDPPLPPIWAHIQYEGAIILLVSQDRRHLFVTPCSKRTVVYMGKGGGPMCIIYFPQRAVCSVWGNTNDGTWCLYYVYIPGVMVLYLCHKDLPPAAVLHYRPSIKKALFLDSCRLLPLHSSFVSVNKNTYTLLTKHIHMPFAVF